MRFRVRSLFIAFQFLTTIPVRLKGELTEEDVRSSASFFIIVGAFQGLILLVVLSLLRRPFHTDPAILLMLLSSILLNGGFHLDGLSDTFDALAVKSTGNREVDINKRLSVMKDSYTGPVGSIAIVSVLLLKYLSMKEILYLQPSSSNQGAQAYIFLMPVISKWAILTSMFHGRPARTEGLGHLFIGRIKTNEVLFCLFTLFLICGSLYLIFSRSFSGREWIFYLFSTGVVYLFSVFWVYFCQKRFRGLTGDTLGALSELSEVFYLLMVILWSELSI